MSDLRWRQTCFLSAPQTEAPLVRVKLHKVFLCVTNPQCVSCSPVPGAALPGRIRGSELEVTWRRSNSDVYHGLLSGPEGPLGDSLESPWMVQGCVTVFWDNGWVGRLSLFPGARPQERDGFQDGVPKFVYFIHNLGKQQYGKSAHFSLVLVNLTPQKQSGGTEYDVISRTSEGTAYPVRLNVYVNVRSLSERTRSVSYTHLTLPTIYSV